MRARALVIALCLSLCARAARAEEPTAQQKAAAEALFEEGKRLKKEGKFLEAAQKLEQSQKLDPGIGTLLHLAEAYEKAGLTASAWGNYREAAAIAQKEADAREKVATERAAKLEPKLARLRVELGANAAIPGLVVKRDRVTLDAAAAAVALPVDAGSVVVEVSAPGYQSFGQTLTVADEQQLVVQVPPLAKVPAPPPPDAAKPAKLVVVPPPEPPPVDERPKQLRIASLGLGIASVVTAGATVGLVARAMSLNRDAAAHCDGTVCRDSYGEQESLDAVRLARVATGGVVIAGATGAAALGLLIASYTVKKTTTGWIAAPFAGERTAGLVVGGGW